MALCWPPSIHDALVQLSDEQDYATLWHALTLWVLQYMLAAPQLLTQTITLPNRRLCFPKDGGFRIHLAPCGSHLFVEIPHSVGMAALLVAITWEPPNKTPGDRPPIPRRENFSEPLYHIHATGLYVSYSEHDLNTAEVFLHRDDGVYHLFEPAGVAFIFQCFEEALSDVGYIFNGGFDDEDVAVVQEFLSSRASVNQEFDATRTYSGARSITGVPDTAHDPCTTTLKALSEYCLVNAPVSFVSALYNTLLTLPSIQITPFNRSFPLDIVAEFLGHLDTESLRAFSACSKLCNDVADRRLWSTFCVASQMNSDSSEPTQRLHAITRNTQRARYIRRLVLGPCGWRWNKQLLSQCEAALLAASKMTALILATYGEYDKPKWGNDFAPVMRILAALGPRIRLQSFNFNSWLEPNSPLIEFLDSQKALTSLTGLDINPRRPPFELPQSPEGFLSKLKLISSGAYRLPQLLQPGRPIRSILVVDEKICCLASARQRLKTLVALSPGLEALSISSSVWGPQLIEEIILQLPHLEELEVTGFPWQDEHLVLLQSLPLLESFYIILSGHHASKEETREWILQWAPPNLRRIEFQCREGEGPCRVPWSRSASVQYVVCVLSSSARFVLITHRSDPEAYTWSYVPQDSDFEEIEEFPVTRHVLPGA